MRARESQSWELPILSPHRVSCTVNVSTFSISRQGCQGEDTEKLGEGWLWLLPQHEAVEAEQGINP